MITAKPAPHLLVAAGCILCCKAAFQQDALPSLAPKLPDLRQGHGGGGGRAQPMRHRHRQEALLAVLAAGVHGGEPGAHGAWGVRGGGKPSKCSHAEKRYEHKGLLNAQPGSIKRTQSQASKWNQQV